MCPLPSDRLSYVLVKVVVIGHLKIHDFRYLNGGRSFFTTRDFVRVQTGLKSIESPPDCSTFRLWRLWISFLDHFVLITSLDSSLPSRNRSAVLDQYFHREVLLQDLFISLPSLMNKDVLNHRNRPRIQLIRSLDVIGISVWDINA